jgi:uncharacterized protein YbjT (DUF2867 family)
MIPHDLHHFFSHVASLLEQTGARVRALARSTKGRSNRAIDWMEGDLLFRDSIDAGIKDCRYVLHVAGDYRFWARDPREIFANNVTELDPSRSQLCSSPSAFTQFVGTHRLAD